MRPRKHIGHIRHHIFFRPLVFIVAGVLAATGLLAVDAAAGPTLLPAWLRFDGGVARPLFISLAGATLTIAGLTFWVRAAAVQMAASQFTPRVVQGFLHDWFQQSIMGLLLGIFAYLVVVVGNLPDAGQPAPNLATVGGIGLAGGSLLAVLWAILNGVESMQAGELARRITELTVDRIHTHHPLGRLPTSDRLIRPVPASAGHVVRADASGWVQEIDEDRLLDPLPAEATLQLDVAVGLFVQQGRALCRVWTSSPLWLDDEARLRRAIRLGRTRTARTDVHYGLQQLSDLARGCLTQGTPDPGAAIETIVHLELILRELLRRELPPVTSMDDQHRQLIRARSYAMDDYLRVAFHELRPVAAAHPSVVAVMLDTLETLARELEQAGHPERATSLRRQADLTLQACQHALLDDDDLSYVTGAAHRVRPHDLDASIAHKGDQQALNN